MDIVEIQAIYYMVAATGVLIAAVFYILNLRISQRNQELMLKAQEQSTKAQQQTLETRQAQLLMGLLQSLVSPEMMDSWHSLGEIEMKNVDDWKKLKQDKKKYQAWTMWASYYNGMGTLVRNKLIDVSLPAQMWGGNVLWFYERYKSMMLDCRDKLNWPGWGMETEDLYNSIIEYGKAHPEYGLGHSGRRRGDE